MATAEPFPSDPRPQHLSSGPFRMSSETAAVASTGHPPHAVGAIGSSRPGSRIADHAHHHPPMPSTKQTPWAEADEAATLSSQRRSLPNDQPSSTFNGHSGLGGYSLTSSMWATPTSITPQAQMSSLNRRLSNPSFSVGFPPPMLKEPDFANNSMRQPTYLATHFENQSGSPGGQATNVLHASPEFPFGKLDGGSAYDSPALSFTQTGSAPSTARSIFASDGCPGQYRNASFSGFSLNPTDESSALSLGPKKYDTSYPSPRSFPPETISNDSSWPLGMSFGEEAFYSKSNVTKGQNTNLAPLRGMNSPGVWKLPDTSRSLSLSSSAETNPSVSLASPLSVQPYTNELMNQLLLRIEQLERKCSKQDHEIHQLKANISLVCAQSQKNYQPIGNSNGNVPNGNVPIGNVPNGNSFQSPARPRCGSLLSTGAAISTSGLSGNIDSAPAGSVNGAQCVQSSTSPLPHRAELAVQAPHLSNHVSNTGLNQRQYGPLDYSSGRPNAGNAAMPIMHQPPPTNVVNQNASVVNGPGTVNYRALLAGDTECDFEYFIRRITEHNDQQASIFMQQKLKQSAVAHLTPNDKNAGASSVVANSTNARKEITSLVIEYSLELMTNRFGNFLVSRAIEHATPDERLSLSERIRGQIVTLAQDTFATHCLQKMIDVDEEAENHVRWMISQELLRKKETVTHKSAGHVWARLLSIGGSSSGTVTLNNGGEKFNGHNQYGDGAGKSGGLERSLNNLLKGEWATTAKDEVGSLIVQSVLENWNEAAKADVVDELLEDIYSCAVQQWGNFVILHLIEHSVGAIQQKLFERLTETQLACELSVDNFGAKAIEKVLKVSGMESRIVEDYVKAICEYGHGRPALIDIACHQAGAQVLTLLFTSAPNPIRDLMIQTVRRNGVTMKSSKAGSKIWFLVERTRAWVGH